MDCSTPFRFFLKNKPEVYASPFTPNIKDYQPPGRASWAVVNPGWFWPATDSGCTCEASRPHWKSSPGKGEPGGPWTSGSLEGSKGGRPTVSKRQRTLQNLSGPEEDAHVKKDTLHYTQGKKEFSWNGIYYHETELISALPHSPCCCSAVTRGDRDPQLRISGPGTPLGCV